MIKRLLDLIPKGASQKLGRDIAYTLGSFFVLAVSGILINIIITGTRDAAALGVFNQAYAIYIVGSQFAVMGVHYSVLRHTPSAANNPTERGVILGTAAGMTLGLGVIAAAIIYFLSDNIGRLFESQPVGLATSFAAFGLITFPLNKVLLAYVNGLRHMRAFAILQAMRYILVMIVVAVVSFSDVHIAYAAISFGVAELLTSASAFIYIKRAGLADHLYFSRAWARIHSRFGVKGLFAGMFAEFNSRVDVLVIGFLLEDRAVGIYSFAAMLVDGLYHVLAMIRINFNPLLTVARDTNDWSAPISLQVKARKYLAPVMAALAAVVAAVYLGIDAWIVPEKGLSDGLPALLILLTGLVVVSPLIPFDNLLMVVGYPGYQTAQQLCSVSVNVIFALLLLPVFGIAGAALGTIGSYMANVTALVLFSKRLVDWDILTNRLKQ